MASTAQRPAPAAKRAKLDTTDFSLPQANYGLPPAAAVTARNVTYATPTTPAGRGAGTPVGTPGVALPAATWVPQSR